MSLWPWMLPALTLQDIAESTAQMHGMSVRSMMDRSRMAHLIRARRDAIAWMRDMGHTYVVIGKFFGLDRSTIRLHHRKGNP